MPKKTKIIFISVFIITGIIILGVYFWLTRNKITNQTASTPWYQSFNPFGGGGSSTTNNSGVDANGNPLNGAGIAGTQTSRFYQITDFAIAGATFLEDTRPIETNTPVAQAPTKIKTIISADTVIGRKEIQTILNKTLSLKTPLVVDGIFGKPSTAAIIAFQKLNNIPTTGKIDTLTAPYFTKTTDATNIPQQNLTEKVPSIRFVQRMNGHIYKMFLDTKSKEKISNSTIPSIYEAYFDSTGKTVIYRYLSVDKIISSFLATIGLPKGEFLPQDIPDISTSFDKTKYFYLTKNINGATGTIGTFGQAKRDVVFSSPFTEWLSQWDSKQNVYLTTKPSYSTNGSMFFLNTTNKTLSKIIGGIAGLTTLISPNGSAVLFSTSTSTGPKLSVYNINKHTTFNLDKYGLPEKCVWSSDNLNIYCAVPNVVTGNQYPDSWYQGLVSFDDYFVKINTITGDTETLANSKDETPVDGTYLFLNRDEDSLFFTNKKDLTLWGMTI